MPGCRACSRAPSSVPVKLDMSVATTPGATALTRMPRGPRLAARCFTSVSIAPLVARHRPAACRLPHGRRARKVKITLDPSPQDRQLAAGPGKKGARTLTANRASKSSTVVSPRSTPPSRCRHLRRGCRAGRRRSARTWRGQLGRSARRGEVRADRTRARPPAAADLLHHGVRLGGVLPVMDQYLRPDFGEGQSGRAADAARRARDECGPSVAVRHATFLLAGVGAAVDGQARARDIAGFRNWRRRPPSRRCRRHGRSA